MVYFISYWTGSDFGYMCYSGVMTAKFLEQRLFSKQLAVLFISEFCDSKETLISYHCDDKFRHEVLNVSISDVEDLGDARTHLLKKYNNVDILSFKGLNGEFKND